MEEKLEVIMILELLGRPPEHLEEGLKTLVTKLSSEKGIKIKEKVFHPPTPIKDSKDLFTAFAEITAEFNELGNFFGIIFAYMPSHIELIKPESIKLSNSDLNDTGNKLIQRLHSYDAIVKNTLNERDFLLEKLKDAAPEIYKQITTPPVNPESQEKRE